jgi:hypothetical protein
MKINAAALIHHLDKPSGRSSSSQLFQFMLKWLLCGRPCILYVSRISRLVDQPPLSWVKHHFHVRHPPGSIMRFHKDAFPLVLFLVLGLKLAVIVKQMSQVDEN